MAFDLDSITTGPGIRPPRIIMLGIPKIGKSCFAAGSDFPVFIPVKGEEGIDDLGVQQFPAANSFANVSEALTTLLYGEHGHQTVCVDSASALEPLIWQDVCECKKVQTIEEVGGGYSKGYNEALYRWRYLTQQLDLLRTHKSMASIIIGHVTVKRFDDPEGSSYDQYGFDIHKTAAAMLYRWADLILFANTKVIVKAEDIGFKKEHKVGVDLTNGTRFLYTQKNPAYPSGGRGVYGRLPAELPLSWQAFRDAVNEVLNPAPPEA